CSGGNGTPKWPSSSFEPASERVGMAGQASETSGHARTRPAGRRSGFERRPEEVADRLDAHLDGVLGHGVAAEQAAQEVDVAEVVEHGAVAADDELLGVVAAE